MKRFQDKKQEQEQLKKDNKGFSLVELIIVIAIMAILVGIVGTQVIPYLNRSREAKDLQIINSFSTAAVSTYSQNAEKFNETDITIKMSTQDTTGDTPEAILARGVWELTGYDSITDVQGAMSSPKGKKISDIEITLSFTDSEIRAQAKDVDGEDFLDPVISHI